MRVDIKLFMEKNGIYNRTYNKEDTEDLLQEKENDAGDTFQNTPRNDKQIKQKMHKPSTYVLRNNNIYNNIYKDFEKEEN